MTREERKKCTYIGGAEIRFENTDRRDRLVKAAKDAGFIVECSEAINISLSGRAGDTHWAISVSAPGILDPVARRDARAKLASVWKGL